MWTSAATRRLIEVFAADNRPQRVTHFAAQFVAMVLPGDTLKAKVRKLMGVCSVQTRGSLHVWGGESDGVSVGKVGKGCQVQIEKQFALVQTEW